MRCGGVGVCRQECIGLCVGAGALARCACCCVPTRQHVVVAATFFVVAHSHHVFGCVVLVCVSVRLLGGVAWRRAALPRWPALCALRGFLLSLGWSGVPALVMLGCGSGRPLVCKWHGLTHPPSHAHPPSAHARHAQPRTSLLSPLVVDGFQRMLVAGGLGGVGCGVLS